MIDKPSDKYKDMLDVISKLKCSQSGKALDELLRNKLEINKAKLKIEEAEKNLCEGGNAMFYFFALSLTNDEINFCLEKLKSKNKRIIKKEEKEKEKNSDSKEN